MSKTQCLLLAVAAAAMGFTFGCSSGGDGGGGSGGGGGSCSANFRTVTIGTQVWAAENLNCDVSGSKCYDNDPANCAKYGRLYDWETAKKACPKGWHLPNNAEWTTLTDYVGGEDEAGIKLKATSGWNSSKGESGNGTDTHGFSALPGGIGNSMIFVYVGDIGLWWSASEYNSNIGDMAHSPTMDYRNERINPGANLKSYLCSVRCLQD